MLQKSVFKILEFLNDNFKTQNFAFIIPNCNTMLLKDCDFAVKK